MHRFITNNATLVRLNNNVFVAGLSWGTTPANHCCSYLSVLTEWALLEWGTCNTSGQSTQHGSILFLLPKITYHNDCISSNLKQRELRFYIYSIYSRFDTYYVNIVCLVLTKKYWSKTFLFGVIFNLDRSRTSLKIFSSTLYCTCLWCTGLRSAHN